MNSANFAAMSTIAIERYCPNRPGSNCLSADFYCHYALAHGEMLASTVFLPYDPVGACRPPRRPKNRLKHSGSSCNSARAARPDTLASSAHHAGNPDYYRLCCGCCAGAAGVSPHAACLSRPILLQSTVSSKYYFS